MTYLDHAATGWPRAPGVAEAVARALAAPPDTWDAAYTRGLGAVARFAGVPPERLRLTPGCTSALSTRILDASWQRDDAVIMDPLAHEALVRPVRQLIPQGVRVVVPPVDPSAGHLDLQVVEDHLTRGGVRAVVMSAACNVTGDRPPLLILAGLARRHGARLWVDAAQTVGWWPVVPSPRGPHAVMFGAHKGTRGPWGVGAIAWSEDARWAGPTPEGLVERSAPTGCDVGSVDRAALVGWEASLAWLAAQGSAEARRRTVLPHLQRLDDALAAASRVQPISVQPAAQRVPVAAFVVPGVPAHDVGRALAARGVRCSAGTHCAPLAHHHLGTAPEGAVRLSLGLDTAESEVEHALAVLSEVLGDLGGRSRVTGA